MVKLPVSQLRHPRGKLILPFFLSSRIELVVDDDRLKRLPFSRTGSVPPRSPPTTTKSEDEEVSESENDEDEEEESEEEESSDEYHTDELVVNKQSGSFYLHTSCTSLDNMKITYPEGISLAANQKIIRFFIKINRR